MKEWFSKRNNSTGKKPTRKDIKWNLCAIGFTSSSVQLLIAKEAMNIFGGNELSFGIFIGIWLLLSAIGVRLGGLSKSDNLKTINYLFFLSPIVSLLLFTFCSTVLVESYDTSIIENILILSLVVAPVCIMSAFAFIRITEISVLDNHDIPGKAFSTETVGEIIGGITIFLLSGLINTYLLLLTIIILSLIYLIYAFLIDENNSIKPIIIAFLVGEMLLVILNPDIFFRKMVLKNSDLNYTKDTPYGNMTIEEKDGEKQLFYNYRPHVFNDDIKSAEEDIHYIMLQNENIRNVFLIGGDLVSNLDELSKYDIEKVTFVDRDPRIIKLSKIKESYPFQIDIQSTDPYSTIKKSRDSYDAIISLIPSPSTLSTNRYYTSDFFNRAKDRLSRKGFFICTPGIYDDATIDEAIKSYSSIYNTLTNTFNNVAPIVGEKLYFLASDEPLDLKFASLSQKRRMNNKYVNIYFIKDDIIQTESNEITNLIDKSVKKNNIGNPTAFLFNNANVLNKNKAFDTITLLVIILLSIIPVLFFKKKNRYMYLNSFVLAGFEIVMILFIQIITGMMYKLTGVIIASVMTGLAIGSGANDNFITKKSIKEKTKIIISFFLLFGLLCGFIDMIPTRAASILIILSTLIPSMIVGSIFKEITKNNGKGDATAKSYGSDLLGAAFGAIIISVVIVPFLGIQISFFILAAINAICLLLNTTS